MSAFIGSASADSGRGISPAYFQYSSSQMGNLPVKIYEKIGDVTFTHSATTLTYHIYFGLAFPNINGSQKIVAYIYLLTDQSYITNAQASLTFTLVITYSGKNITRTGVVSDSTSMLQFGNELYAFEMLCMNFASSEFPMTMDVGLDYTLSSTDLPDLSKTDTYTTSKYFLSSVMELWVLIIIICVAGGVGVLVIVLLVVHAKKKKAGPVAPAAGLISSRAPPAGGTGAPVSPV
ncbi:MAG: hypothetical protein JW839_04120 [Candidatus Lokiarchaeota archaeon]|nr:hypothetical protein [Candidatus Lokiarchaeota archaeon]